MPLKDTTDSTPAASVIAARSRLGPLDRFEFSVATAATGKTQLRPINDLVVIPAIFSRRIGDGPTNALG